MTTKASRRREQRERLKAERLRQQARQRRLKLLGVIGAATLVVAALVGGGYLYMASADQSSSYEGPLAEQTLQEDGSVVMAQEGAEAPVVEVYADFQCPSCKRFEEVNAATLEELAAQGEAIVHLRPVSIFAAQGEPLGSNSLRAAAAARAAADHGAFIEYSKLLWERQPEEGAPGYSKDDLVAWGAEVGITDPAFAERLDAESAAVEEFVGYLPALRAAAETGLSEEELQTMSLDELVAWGSEHGAEPPDLEGSYVQEVLDATAAVNAKYPEGSNAFQGTPSVYVNGERLGDDMYTVRGLRSAVEDAASATVDTRPLAASGSAAAGLAQTLAR